MPKAAVVPKMVAKTDAAHRCLAEQIKQHSFTREYEAVAVGYFKETEGTIDAPIGRHKTDRKKMCVTTENSRNAVTHYSVIKQYGGYAHLRLRLETGRTHQIRVHLAYLGHPVLGDDVYGKPYKGLDGQCLHARKVGFIHPKTKKYMEFSSELPEYFQEVLRKLEKMRDFDRRYIKSNAAERYGRNSAKLKKADNGCRQSSDRELYASRRKIHGSHGAHDTVF